ERQKPSCSCTSCDSRAQIQLSIPQRQFAGGRPNARFDLWHRAQSKGALMNIAEFISGREKAFEQLRKTAPDQPITMLALLNEIEAMATRAQPAQARVDR